MRRRSLVVSISPDSSASRIEVAYETQGVHAPGFRRRFAAASTRHDRVIEDVSREIPGFELAPGPAAVQTGDLDDFQEPATLSARGRAPRFARKEGKNLSVPLTPGLRLTPSYASLSTRKLPIDLPPLGTLEDRILVRPQPGLRIVSLPKGSRLSSRFGSLEVAIRSSGGEVEVTTHFTLRTSRILPKDYAEWKQFCRDVDAALDVRLTLEASR